MDLHQQVRLAASVVSRQATGGRNIFTAPPPTMVVRACVLTWHCGMWHILPNFPTELVSIHSINAFMEDK